jgi:hypothetical protein
VWLRLAVAASETEEEKLRRCARQRRSYGGVRDCGRHGETDEVARLRVRGGRRWCGAAVKEGDDTRMEKTWQHGGAVG